MAAAIIATPTTRRPRRLPPSLVAVQTPAQPDLAAHERAVIDAALSIIEHHWKNRGGAIFDQPQRVKDFMRLQLGHLEHEVFGVMFLDTQMQLIAFEHMFRGTLAYTSVHPREIVKRALALNAGAVILAHNHPSGTCEPSRADELVTQGVSAALQLVGVRVVDHLVVGCCSILSFAERGLL
jgi:DNA repair protein RadC